MGILIDTDIWVDVERGALSPADVAAVTGSEPVFLSPVTIAELKFGADNAEDPDSRQRRLAALDRLKRKPVLLIDASTGEVFGRLAAELRRTGRGHEFPIQDLWLASQAVQHGFGLLTRNRKDVQDVPGLDLRLLPARS